MGLEKFHFTIGFIVTYIIAIVSILWLFNDNSHEPLIVGLGSVTALAGVAIGIFNHIQEMMRLLPAFEPVP